MKTASPKFRNAKGQLTAYAYACGYRSTRETKAGKAQLEKDPNGNFYYVRKWNAAGKLFFEITHAKLSDARLEFRRQSGQLGYCGPAAF